MEPCNTRFIRRKCRPKLLNDVISSPLFCPLKDSRVFFIKTGKLKSGIFLILDIQIRALFLKLLDQNIPTQTINEANINKIRPAQLICDQGDNW